jgi:hypothetical protein
MARGLFLVAIRKVDFIDLWQYIAALEKIRAALYFKRSGYWSFVGTHC